MPSSALATGSQVFGRGSTWGTTRRRTPCRSTRSWRNGALVCLPDWSPAAAAQLIAEERITSLYLVPTLYHDLVSLPDLTQYDVSSATTLGYAGAPMASTLAHDVARVFRPRKFLN